MGNLQGGPNKSKVGCLPDDGVQLKKFTTTNSGSWGAVHLKISTIAIVNRRNHEVVVTKKISPNGAILYGSSSNVNSIQKG